MGQAWNRKGQAFSFGTCVCAGGRKASVLPRQGLGQDIDVPVIGSGAFLGGGERGTAHDSLEAGRRCRDSTLDVFSLGLRMGQKIGRLVHPDEFGFKVEEKGGLEFSASLFHGLAFDDVGDIDRHEVDDFGGRILGKRREQCFDMGFVALSSDDHDFIDAVVVPTGEEFIDRAMEGFPAQRACTGVRSPIRLREPVVEGRSHRQLQATGEIERDMFGDECVRSERKVWSVVIERPDGKDQPCVAAEYGSYFWPGKAVEPQ